MKALRSHAIGGPDSLTLDELESPVPGPGQVRIKVKACSINYPDVLIIKDMYQFKPARPFAPGGELAGIVDAVGDVGGERGVKRQHGGEVGDLGEDGLLPHRAQGDIARHHGARTSTPAVSSAPRTACAIASCVRSGRLFGGPPSSCRCRRSTNPAYSVGTGTAQPSARTRRRAAGCRAVSACRRSVRQVLRRWTKDSSGR